MCVYACERARRVQDHCSSLWDLQHLEFEKEEHAVFVESKIEFLGEKAEEVRRNEIMAALVVAVDDSGSESGEKSVHE